ncbi:leucine--tRNA ligase [Buchnera aphidicola (Ceratoglyphina bambusae)]|uniref:leucine--tRNA ligase n=1 Tax=Buchnera aphidicola TaxID=9 RepID=UPI0031B88FAA
MEKEYDHNKIEKKVQKYWEKHKTFNVKKNYKKKKYYCLSMLPYPSGNLHMGHIRNYTISDIIARYHRMLDMNVLHPIGWDSFGLPAEEAAIKNNIDPLKWTYKNIKEMKKQLKLMGFSYDWSREITTCDPKFYMWEQYIFTKLYKKKIAYKKMSPVNWCNYDKTVLANEQVIKGKCWRCNNKVKTKNMEQWFIKTKKYAKKLYKNIKYLKKWPKKVKEMQKKWIGYSKKIKFYVQVKNDKKIPVYTTRLDTLYGSTFVLLSYKNKFIKKKSKKNLEIKKIVKKCKKNAQKNIKKSYKTNLYALNPINKKLIPIWITNYFIKNKKKTIISSPAHNKKEWKFAIKNNIKIIYVVKNYKYNKKTLLKKIPFTKKGIIFNCEKHINGLNSKKAEYIIKKKLEKITKVSIKKKFKLKDWNVSRQRYWGTPIPIATLKNGKKIPVPKKKLPIKILDKINYKKTNKIKINNNIAVLENDTFDTFMESSWYYIRYTSPKYKINMVDPISASYWLPVDFYVGGIEHATMHLIYFRLYCKILKDLKIIKFNEPVINLLCQGMVLSEAFYTFKNKKKIWVAKKEIKIKKNHKGKITNIKSKIYKNKINYYGMVKMSKSKNNGVEPTKIIKKYGADSLRFFIMSAAPVEKSLIWKEEGISGARKFIKKIWNISNKILKKNNLKRKINLNMLQGEEKKILYDIYKTIKDISKNMKEKKFFNVSISKIIIITKKIENFYNKNIYENKTILIKEFILIILKLLNPFIPHTIFYIFKKFNILNKINGKCWPKINKKFFKKKYCNIVIQINGKKRYVIKIKKNSTKEKIMLLIKNKKVIQKYIIEKKIKKIIFIKNKIVNIVI